MRIHSRSFPVLLLALALLVTVSACSKEGPAPRVGSIAPGFSLVDLSGEPVQLSDFRGMVVVLNFWATWCPPCQGEVPSLSRLNTAMTGKKFRMVTVSIDKDGRDAAEAFFRKLGYRLPTLPDPAGRVGKLYGITGVPETFVIDPQGVIREKVVGPIAWDDPSVVSFLSSLLKE